ncbi:monocarboxylate transporter 14 isoform X3 [Leptinotarsa decemlineata]|uniref:monocarboxylate transporter 14 isoform X3 n=1 Tax=Leptinotarsa decemlineata TaxID=7539 RepID=UPI003D306C38
MARVEITSKEKVKLAAEQDPEDVIPGPPDGGYGWVVVLASFLCNLMVGGISYSFGICISDLVQYYGESKGTTAWVGSALTGCTMCAGPLATAFANKFGCRTACMTGTNLCFAGLILTCTIFGALMKPLEWKPTRVTTTIQKVPSKITHSRRNFREDPSETETIYNSILSVDMKHDIIPPLGRKDIFYSGSLTNLKEFQSQGSLNHYRQSVIISSRSRSKSVCLPKGISDTLRALLDFSLLKDPVFMMQAISTSFTMIAFYIPFVYIIESAEIEGIEASNASFLLSLIGMVNTAGRIVFGFIADSPKVDPFLLFNLCISLTAVSIILIPFCHNYGTYVIVSIGFGIGASGYMSLTAVTLVELLGLDKLTNAFGLIILFRGTAALIGSPMGGALYDATQSYHVSYFVAGGLFAVAAAVSFSTKCFRTKKTSDKNEVLVSINA